MAYFEGEIPTVVSGNGYGNNGGMWGQDGIWAILLLALLGNRGFGGGFGGGGSEFVGYELGKTATQADIASGFNNSAVLSSLNDLKLGQANGFAGVQQTLCQGFSGVNQTVLNGFAGVDNSICTLGYNLTHQISDCCCATQRAIDSVNFNNAKNTCDIIQAINSGNQRVIDYMQSEKIDTLNRKLAVAEGQISQYAQTNAIVAALKPQPVPSYSVPNPNCCYNNFGCGGTTL